MSDKIPVKVTLVKKLTDRPSVGDPATIIHVEDGRTSWQWGDSGYTEVSKAGNLVNVLKDGIINHVWYTDTHVASFVDGDIVSMTNAFEKVSDITHERLRAKMAAAFENLLFEEKINQLFQKHTHNTPKKSGGLLSLLGL